MIAAYQDSVSKAQAIKKFFDELRIGYNGSSDCRCVVGPEPFFISRSIHDQLINQGKLLKEWFSVTHNLCVRSYQDPNFRWLADVVEGNINSEVVAVHRRAYTENAVRLPTLARADMSDIGVTVEMQVPGSGWGYMTALYSTVNGNSAYLGPNRGMGEAIRSITGSSQSLSAYILYNQPLFWEVDYFCSRCQDIGIPLTLYFQKVPKPGDARFVRRPPLEDLISYEGSSELIDASFRGEVDIEPSLSLLYDQKISIAFPFDPRIRDEYSDDIRNLFPETFLIQEEITPCFEGVSISWDGIISLSRKKRQFIVKFGGAKKELRAGGKAVYNLADCNSEEAKQIIHRALNDWKVYHKPWLIQRRIKKKFDVSFLDPESQTIVTRPYYALFRPMFLFPRGDDKPYIIDNCALFRHEWKVHGSSDAVNLPVEVLD